MQHKKITAAAAALALALSLAGCGNGAPQESTEETGGGVAIQTQTVATDQISTENKVSGKIAADNEHSIFVSASAKCTAVYAEAGDTVSAGAVICTLDLSSTLAQYQSVSISHSAAVQSYQDQKVIYDEQIRLYEKNLSDLKALYEIGAASQTEIDQAELTLKTSKASRESTLAQLEAGIQNYQSSLDQLNTVLEDVDGSGNVIAPISGTVVTMNAEENSYTSPSVPVAVIDGADQMKVQVSVSEALVPKLQIGDTAEVYVGALDRGFTGTVRSVEKAANAQTKLYNVTLSVPETVSGLLSGMFADVTFQTDTAANAVVIPTEALLTSGEEQYVFVVEDGLAVRRSVAAGLTGNGVTEITSGLSAGEELVTVGQSYLTDGAAVRVVSGED